MTIGEQHSELDNAPAMKEITLVLRQVDAVELLMVDGPSLLLEHGLQPG